jgi:transcriptional regulator of arginine metabolism
MDKEKRQGKILSLIRAKRIGTQQELTAYLERAGVEATQSSVSRDLEELGVVKQYGYYTLPQARDGDGGGTRGKGVTLQGLLSLDAAGDCLVVAKCEAGLASAVAVAIDRAMLPEIVGTLAGEDTVFIAVQERKAQRAAIKKIWELFG